MRRKFFFIGFIVLFLVIVSGYFFYSNNEVRFFPKGVFSINSESIDMKTYDYYSKSLLDFNESRLYKSKVEKNEIKYRFLYLRSFNNPIMIRIEINSLEGTGELFYKTGKQNYGNKFDLKKSKKIDLSTLEIKQLQSKINTVGFWDVSSSDIKKGMVLDGANWVFEGVDSTKYHLIDRWSPQNGAIKELGLLFIQLSKEKVGDIY